MRWYVGVVRKAFVAPFVLVINILNLISFSRFIILKLKPLYFFQAPTGYLHIIVLIYSNIMGIQLLYNVKNYGSWLDIGTSISQFVIVQVITLFIVLINQIAKILTDISMQMFIGGVFGESLKKYV